MKKLLLAPVAALALSSCAGLGALMAPPAPAAVANASILDEQAAMTAELAYKAARVAVELAVDSGKLTGVNASRAAELDRKAFEALAFVRAAYRTGNAADYRKAVEEGRSAVAALLSTIS